MQYPEVNIISANPAFKLLLVFAAGICVFLNFTPTIPILAILFVLFIALGFKRKLWQIAYIAGVFALSGLTIYQIDSTRIDFSDKVFPDMKGIFVGKIDKILHKSDKYIRLKVSGSLDLKQFPEIPHCGIFLNIFKLNNVSDSLRAGNSIYMPVWASLPRNKTFPIDFNEKFYARYNDVQFYARGTADRLAILDDAKNFNQYSKNFADKIEERIDSLFYPDVSGVVKAILVGNKSDLDKNVRDVFSLSGTAHILAVSGLHVGIIAGILMLFLSGLENRKVKFVIFSVLIFGYAAITGFCPSVMRAGFMAVLLHFVYSIDRKPEALNIFSFAVVMLVVLFPTLIYSPGFQMSAGSVLGILLLFPIFRKSMLHIFRNPGKIANYIVSSLAVTFSASIVVSPLVAAYFGVFSIVSPLANLIVIPIMSLAMIYSIIALVLSCVYFPLGLWFAGSSNLLLTGAIEINKFAVSLPYSSLTSGNLTLIAVFASLITLYVLSSNNRKKLIFRLSSCAIGIFLVVNCVNISNKKQPCTVYPLKNLVVAEISLSSSELFFYVADRKNKQYPFYDHSLYNHLISCYNDNKKIYIGVTGNVGIATCDKLKDTIKYTPIEMNFAMQDSVEQYLKLNKHITQYILPSETQWN